MGGGGRRKTLGLDLEFAGGGACSATTSSRKHVLN